MKGRRPKSPAEKALKGDKLIDRPLPPKAELPQCPAWLEEKAAAIWASRILDLAAMGHVAAVDTEVLAAYCQTAAWYEEAVANIAEHGQVIEGRANPMVRIADLHAKTLRAYAVELGFTPNSRSRMKAPPAPSEESDELDRFLEG